MDGWMDGWMDRSTPYNHIILQTNNDTKPGQKYLIQL